jgi:hypothetical protein
MPAPRENATLTASGYSAYMIGGMNQEPIKEIVRARVMGDTVAWERVEFKS